MQLSRFVTATKTCPSYHKNGLVSSHQSVGRWFIFYVLCSNNILTQLVGYQQPTCLCQDGICGRNHFAFMWIAFTFVELLSFMWVTTVYRKWCFVLHVQCCGRCMVGTEYAA